MWSFSYPIARHLSFMPVIRGTRSFNNSASITAQFLSSGSIRCRSPLINSGEISQRSCVISLLLRLGLWLLACLVGPTPISRCFLGWNVETGRNVERTNRQDWNEAWKDHEHKKSTHMMLSLRVLFDVSLRQACKEKGTPFSKSDYHPQDVFESARSMMIEKSDDVTQCLLDKAESHGLIACLATPVLCTI